MPDLDHYEIYYADKLWNLIPGVYRSLDTESFGAKGPLREMVERIGAQAAVVRRSMDRLWQDQSIETCDDWVIPYIADLLATNLVASLDARGQRLDVAKTIYYRRRKGTVGILEEIAHDITGWNARVVEFFHRLGRTRHNFDPEIGLPSPTDDSIGNRALQLAEGIIGQWTGTSIGGWADLRNVYGASHAQSPFGIYPASKPSSAFDEYFHTADFRQGKGRSGWYNIPKLGVFLWRLESFRVGFTTPVADAKCPGYFSFDPTGREIPLFATSARSFGVDWVSPQEWQLPTPISTPLLSMALANPATQPLYAALAPDGVTLQHNVLGIFTKPGSDFELLPSTSVTTLPFSSDKTQTTIYPETGTFKTGSSLTTPLFVTYCYGFPSTIGAGPYDRRVLGQPEPDLSGAIKISGGGNALNSLPSTSSIQINDSLTYTSVANLNVAALAIIAGSQTRPVIRTTPGGGTWFVTGQGDQSTLLLDGLFFSRTDVVLAGTFASVTLRCCTFDPGTVAADGNFAKAIDGQNLTPCRLFIEADIEQMTIDRCIIGPILTPSSPQGVIQTLTANDSIIHALGSSDTAIELLNGQAQLARCSILGQTHAHRLYASECIFDDLTIVENTQDGCIRFSAWTTGSTLPRQYRSVQIAPGTPLFTSRDFGQPGYCQLQAGVDAAIIFGAPGATISAGAEDGSEMGAYARNKNPIKERSLLIKYQEFMPLGIAPVIIYVT